MTLQEIIDFHDNLAVDETMAIAPIVEHLDELREHYKKQFGCEPVLMIAAMVNTELYAKIVPANKFVEKIDEFVNTIPDISEDERKEIAGIIAFNSAFVKNLL